LRGTLDALGELIRLSDPAARIVPGHGAVTRREDVIRFRDIIISVQSEVAKLIAQDMTLEAILAAKLTSSYDNQVPGGLDPITVGGISSADRFVSEIYTALKAHAN
jgi:cyclase